MAKFSQKLTQLKDKFSKTPQGQVGTGLGSQLLPLVVCILVVVAVFSGVLGYKFGERQGKKHALVITNHKNESVSADEVKALYLENEILKVEVATLIQERDISLNHLNLMRDEVEGLKEEYNEVNALNQALASADPNDKSPVQVLDMSIKPIAIGSNVFEYNFDVLISSTTDKRLIPKLTLLNATNLVEIPLTPKEFMSKGVVKIHGKFAMPDNFTPNQLKLLLNIEGQSIVKLYNWQGE